MPPLLIVNINVGITENVKEFNKTFSTLLEN